VTELQNQEFREQQAPSKYPFADRATLRTNTGLDLPADTFLDAIVYPPGVLSQPRITQVVIVNRVITIHVGDATQPSLATTAFDPLFPPDELFLTDAYGRPAGVLVSEIERLTALQAWPQGTHVFALTAAEFAASCTIPLPAYGVSGFQVEDRIMTDDVWLVGENGVTVRWIDDAIRIDIVGDPLFIRRGCDDVEAYEAPTFVRRINGIGTTDYGILDFYVHDELSNTVLRIYPISSDTLKIELAGQTVEG
jgi:hypothetical protein